MRHLFGPVLSRRLGLSMGVDLLPLKTCNMDCIYCELGCTSCLASERGSFFPPERVLREIRSRADDGFDFLTFAGSGEPTLSKDLGEIVRGAKEVMDSPVAVITNSSLLSREDVRRDLAAADVVLPSLDAATQETFIRVNRPAPGLKIDEIIEGLKAFRAGYGGEIWLEVMLARGVNDHEAELIARAAEEISPDRIQLNTVIRPPPEPVEALTEDEIFEALEFFEGGEIIPDWDWSVPRRTRAEILGLIEGSPCTIEEIGDLMGLPRTDALKYMKILEHEGECVRQSSFGRSIFSRRKA